MYTNVKAKDANDQAESSKEKQARQSMDAKAKADKCQDESSKEKQPDRQLQDAKAKAIE